MVFRVCLCFLHRLREIFILVGVVACFAEIAKLRILLLHVCTMLHQVADQDLAQ